MADENPTDRESSDLSSPAAEDARTERVVLQFILAQHPDQLTVAELTRAIATDPSDFACKDAIERAVQELEGAGLLRRQGEAIAATRPARYFDRLEEG